MSPYDQGVTDASRNEWNNTYQPGSDEYHEYARGHFETTEDGE